ncbi:A24 family peptidase [Rhodococcoides kyotonense]|uniref:A24 family peptidase n=1 Tax=Rhodococcoides kyotonense TaxID=398843 RepID=UPI003182BBF5
MFGGAPAVAVFGWWCVCLSSIDVGSRRLPNTLTATGVLAIGLYAVAVDRFPSMLAGAAGLFACYLVVHLSLPRALGAGDVKLAWALGGVAGMAGVDAWALGAVAAPLLTGLCGAVLSGSGRRHARVPHGPAMCAATLLALAT